MKEFFSLQNIFFEIGGQGISYLEFFGVLLGPGLCLFSRFGTFRKLLGRVCIRGLLFVDVFTERTVYKYVVTTCIDSHSMHTDCIGGRGRETGKRMKETNC